MNPADIRINLQQGILEWDDGARVRSVLPSASVLDFGAIGDGTVDDTEAFRKAIASVPLEGGRLRIPWVPGGVYKLTDTIFIRRSNTVIELDPGAFVKKDSSTNVNAPFRFEGDTPGAFTTFTDRNANEVTITVASSSGFAVGDWIEIKDNEPPATGSTGIHHEINRIRAIAANVFTLYYPLADDYVTISSVAPSTRRIVPVVGSGIEGFGRIQNGDSGSIGNAGVDFSYCVGGFVKNLEFLQIREDAVRYSDSMAGLITGCYMHDTTTFDGRGRGISARSSTHVIIAKNRVDRSRHAFDISFFTRFALVEGNTARGSALAPLKTHPNTKWIWFTGNTVDGCYGYDSAGTEWGTDTEAVGGSVDHKCQHITFEGNEFANIRTDGVLVIPVDTHHIVVKNNRFKRCNTDDNTSSAAVRAVQAGVTGSASENRGYVVEGNEIVDCRGRGIVIGMNGAVVKGNKIREIRASTGDICGIFVRAVDNTTPTVTEVLDVLVEANRIEGCDGHGIQVGSSDAKCRGTVVKGNTIRNCVKAGIYASPQFNGAITISGANDIENVNNVGSGDIDFGGIVVDSISSTAGANGVDGEKVVKGNICRGIMRNGILVNTSGIVVDENDCLAITSATGSIGFGIQSRPPGGSNVVDEQLFANNIVARCATDGIRIGSTSGQGTTDARLIDNIAIDNTQVGIRIQATCTNAVLDKNFAKGNATADYQDNGTTTVIGFNTDGTTNRYGLGVLAPDSQFHQSGKHHVGGEIEVDGDLNHDGTNVGFHGATPVARSTGWTITNSTSDKVLDCNSTSIDELADVLATLINFLISRGDLGT